ncbi:MAG: 5-formyltetrahydrofolate cyclo-ligase [Firmicutes bacterium]|nr:5-formyltetrahydrofolate cyclo-ligase [Bacillota bacterium]
MKKELRKRIIARRNRLTEDEIAQKSRCIAERLYAIHAYRQARTVMFFLSFGTEVDTGPMVEESLARGKRVVVPKVVPAKRELILSRLLHYPDDLAPGLWGIPEPRPQALRPLPVDELELVIVPGVAFDWQGGRLGYGGGYYDRFLARLQSHIPLIAFAFEVQLVDSVPVEPWDRRVDQLITEKEIYDFQAQK